MAKLILVLMMVEVVARTSTENRKVQIGSAIFISG